ncbi:MAG: hypothetical protein M3P38_04030 [Chloroflexota bacterium]|nr:hypothetical protein [Chloroflexota bacterium]
MNVMHRRIHRGSFLVLILLVAAACSSPASNAPSPTANTPAASAATSTPTPTTAPATASPATPTPTLTVLPTNATISAPSGDVVWMFVGGTRLFRSLDRGNTWAERGLPAGARSGEVTFASDRDGLFVQTSGQCAAQQLSIWATHDGASTWELIAAQGIADARCKSRPSLIDSQHAFLVASDDTAAPGAPAIYASADGGRTWTVSRALPNPTGFKITGPGDALLPGLVRGFGSTLLLDVFGQQTGAGAQFAYRSVDGGASWTYASTAPITQPRIAFVTANRWLQISSPNDSPETTDGGATWHAYTTDYQQAAGVAPQIVFGDANVGYATVRGALQRTVDGGAHWTSLRTPGT